MELRITITKILNSKDITRCEIMMKAFKENAIYHQIKVNEEM